MGDPKGTDHALRYVDHCASSNRGWIALNKRAGHFVRRVHLTSETRELRNNGVVQVRAIFGVQDAHVVLDVLQARMPLVDDDFHGNIGISYGLQLV